MGEEGGWLADNGSCVCLREGDEFAVARGRRRALPSFPGLRGAPPGRARAPRAESGEWERRLRMAPAPVETAGNGGRGRGGTWRFGGGGGLWVLACWLVWGKVSEFRGWSQTWCGRARRACGGRTDGRRESLGGGRGRCLAAWGWGGGSSDKELGRGGGEAVEEAGGRRRVRGMGGGRTSYTRR